MALLVSAPIQVDAVGLGEITVQSPLGRPLQAVVPIRVGKGETLLPNCVKPRKTQGPLSQPPNLLVQSPVVSGPGVYDIRISTPGSLHEPMYELSLVINCPGTPVLVRHYVFMLDLPEISAAAPVAKMPEAAVDQRQTPAAAESRSTPGPAQSNRVATAPNSTRSLDESAAPINAGTMYRIRRGDTLSTIAARIDGRLPNATWAVARHLFAKNSDAFIGNDPNLIKLGSLIRIPSPSELATIAPDSNRLASESEPGLRDPMPLPQPRPSVDGPSLAVPRVELSNAEVEFKPSQGDAPALRSDIATAQTTGDAIEELPTADMDGENVEDSEIWAFEDEGATQSSGIDDQAVESPFLDEAPANAVEPDAQLQTASTPPVALEPAEDISNNRWLVIGFGLLLGLVIGALMLRRRFQTIAVNLIPSHDLITALAARIMKPKILQKSGDAGQPTATAAFRTTADERSGSIPLPIGDPMEKTYIVETLEEPTTQDIAPASTEAVDASADEQLAQSEDFEDSSSTDRSDEDLLAEIFAEEPADGTGAVPGQLDPTSKLPQTPDLPEDDIFDPTSELPQQIIDDVSDPMTDLPFDPIADDDSSLMQAFTEKLEEVDPQTFDANAQIDAAEAAPESERIASSADEEISLGALPKASDEDDELSETLYDALTLLERDYEDEFTASQILERTAIKESLATLEAEDEEKGDDDESIDRELAG